MKIVFQGDIGSNAEEATRMFIEKLNLNQAEPVALVTSKNVAMALLEGRIDYGVMATRNFIVGEVEETKNELCDEIEIVCKIKMPIHHCLFTKSENVKIACVASHIQALKQTRNTRKRILPGIQEMECEDTAVAAKKLKNGEYPTDFAVICRQKAGEFYGLCLYALNIEDDPSNMTEFGLFANTKVCKD